jgi:hypothetical protein
MQTNNNVLYLFVCQVDLKMVQIAGLDMPEFQSDPVVGLPASYSNTHFRIEKTHSKQ